MDVCGYLQRVLNLYIHEAWALKNSTLSEGNETCHPSYFKGSARASFMFHPRARMNDLGGRLLQFLSFGYWHGCQNQKVRILVFSLVLLKFFRPFW